MRGRPFGDRRSGRNAAERGIATVFKEKRMPRRHPFVLAGSVSRVLYSAARFRCGAPVIYLRRRSPAASSNLPPDIGRATLNCRYTRSCNPSDVRPATSLPPRWALTPPFHPYPCKQGRSFSVTLPQPHGCQVISLRGALRCPDFPLPACGRQRQSGPAGQR